MEYQFEDIQTNNLRNSNQRQKSSQIFANKRYTINVPQELFMIPFFQFKKQAIKTKLIMYSSRIYLYTTPLTSFNTLDFIDQQIHSLKDIHQYYGNLALAINNTQFKEEPQFLKYQPETITRNNPNPLNIVVQIAQENHFIHQSYSFPEDSQIKLVKSLLQRYGNTLFVQYYTVRVPLTSFGDNQQIKNTLCKIKDASNRVTLYVSRYHQNQNIAAIRGQGNLAINFHKYVHLIIQDYDEIFIIDRRVKWNVIAFIFSIIFNQPLLLEDQLGRSFELSPQTEYQLKKDQKVVTMKKLKSPLYQFAKPLEHCSLIGQRNTKLYLFQKSNIIHIYSANKQRVNKIKSVMLESPQSENNDQQYAFLTQSHLILFNISINYIILKHYDPDTCVYLYTRRCKHCFEGKFELQFHTESMVLDILTVSVKKNSLNCFRIFEVNNPERYIQIQNISNPNKCRTFVARKGQNCYSDRTGIFALVNEQSNKIAVYSLVTKRMICQLNSLDLLPERRRVNNVFFGEQRTDIISNKSQCLYIKREMAIEYSSNQVHVYQIQYGSGIQNQQSYDNLLSRAQFLYKFFISTNSIPLYFNGLIASCSTNYVTIINDNQKLQERQKQMIIVQKQGPEIRIPQQFVIMEQIQSEKGGNYLVKDNPFIKRIIKGVYFLNSSLFQSIGQNKQT